MPPTSFPLPYLPPLLSMVVNRNICECILTGPTTEGRQPLGCCWDEVIGLKKYYFLTEQNTPPIKRSARGTHTRSTHWSWWMLWSVVMKRHECLFWLGIHWIKIIIHLGLSTGGWIVHSKSRLTQESSSGTWSYKPNDHPRFSGWLLTDRSIYGLRSDRIFFPCDRQPIKKDRRA